jgi:dienelactone hydrolase
VVDHICDRPDVDMSKLALVGISFGGQLAPIAASREPRFSALLSLPGTASLAKTVDVRWSLLHVHLAQLVDNILTVTSGDS